jgi:hypothetical protein
MAATGRPSAYRTRRFRAYRYPQPRVVSEEYYENCRDCCCHKLGDLRPHSPAQCRDVA